MTERPPDPEGGDVDAPPDEGEVDALADEGSGVDALLERVGFEPSENVLTRRQAEVLALRERGRTQAAVAELLGTTRANVANVEASARKNVRKARETVAFADVLRAPVRVTVEAGTDIYDVPDAVYSAADGADITVEHAAPELMKIVFDAAEDSIRDRRVVSPLLLIVRRDGSVRVRRSGQARDDPD